MRYVIVQQSCEGEDGQPERLNHDDWASTDDLGRAMRLARKANEAAVDGYCGGKIYFVVDNEKPS